MSDTEKLLEQAQDMARRAFEEPGEETVMRLFTRLCDEADMRKYAAPAGDGETLH
ncbi:MULTISPECIES: hypothetical protein [unclassified Achromobacter]|uniref:hypothetical protein n=1 Tax=unclassified Achromobacter TaxID=2626865 RepID=UPI0018E9C4D2|nr:MULTISPECIES: hypothetical protein [unclassified Achromobacter]